MAAKRSVRRALERCRPHDWSARPAVLARVDVSCWHHRGGSRAFGSVAEEVPPSTPFKIAGAFVIGTLTGGAGGLYYASLYNVSDPTKGATLDAMDPSEPSEPYKRTLYIMRGVPGCGKSTVARDILHRHLATNGISGPLDQLSSLCRGFIFSTDDFFSHINEETGKEETLFDMKQIRRHHEQNQSRCSIAMELGVTPIIVDNTNTVAWEMRAYVELAKAHGYHIIFKDVMEMQQLDFEVIKERLLSRKSETGKDVPVAAVEKMLKRYQKLPKDTDEAVKIILEAEPPRKKSLAPK